MPFLVAALALFLGACAPKSSEERAELSARPAPAEEPVPQPIAPLEPAPEPPIPEPSGVEAESAAPPPKPLPSRNARFGGGLAKSGGLAGGVARARGAGSAAGAQSIALGAERARAEAARQAELEALRARDEAGRRQAEEQGALKGAEQDPLWAVQPFGQQKGWLAGGGAELAAKAWGERLAEQVERALRARERRAQVVPEQLSDSDMEALYRQGLSYLIGGKLVSAGQGAKGRIALSALYRLRRKTPSGLHVVQTRKVSVSARGELDEAGLEALIQAAAGEIAGHALADIPADLLAQRG